MPRRQSIIQIPTDEIQGEGSWVKFKSLRVKKVREVIRQSEGATKAEAFEMGMGILREVLIGWNWADEDGQPLPQPVEDPNQLDDLTNEESEYLIDLFQQQAQEAKNSKRRSPPRSG